MATKPKTFFLNEKHELTRDEYIGGGGLPKYVNIEWGRKARQISSSIDESIAQVRKSRDPLKEHRFFLVAQPDRKLQKKSEAKRKTEVFEAPADFRNEHLKVFERLGLDLLQVTDEGLAVVHGDAEVFGRLSSKSKELEDLGPREQSRWATIAGFDTIPIDIRVDGAWLNSLRPNRIEDVVFELQPVLNRIDADHVLRAIADLLASKPGEQLTGTGTDFSGRVWFRGKATHGSVRAVARDFASVQSVHPPQYSVAFATPATSRSSPKATSARSEVEDPRGMPCVAILDLGVPSDHIHLAPYRRGIFVPQGVDNLPLGDHGSFVASRVVFGEHRSSHALEDSQGQCSFYDAMVGEPYAGELYSLFDKTVMEAMSGVRGAAPDIRVFNLSLGDFRPLGAFDNVVRKERRLLLQELDNFAFFNDVAIVVAAGNSKPGAIPNPMYPKSYDDAQWALGPMACGYNTLVCGSFVGKLSTGGLAQSVGWPSPFTRIGPGLCDAPVPSFSAEGGNSTSSFQFASGHGVWGYSAAGHPEDRAGTSFAAPILARDVAFAFRELDKYCAPGTQPFTVTVRAFLALTAKLNIPEPSVAELAKRTLGFGKASAKRISSPSSGTAVILWQGILDSVRDQVTVQIPIPSKWLEEASKPVLRFFLCYDSPVNEIAHAVWACRKVEAVLMTGPEEDSVRAPTGKHATYSLVEREYKLNRYAPGGEKPAPGDMWVVRLRYQEIAPYPPGRIVDSRQRVAFAAELVDRGDDPVDPQAAVQALPAAEQMVRLSALATSVRTPVIVRTR